MSPSEIYAVMVQAGFPPVVATSMTAIALRESGGNPNALNTNTVTGDRSYGLLQINMLSLEVQTLVQKEVLKGADEKALLDPLTNAKAGFVLWGGKLSNLKLAWYIDRPVYMQRYEKQLPAAQAAALAYYHA